MTTAYKDQFGDFEAEVSVNQFNAFNAHISSAGVALRAITTQKCERSDKSTFAVSGDAHSIITQYFDAQGVKYASAVIIRIGDDRLKGKYIIHREGLRWLQENVKIAPITRSEQQILEEFLNMALLTWPATGA